MNNLLACTLALGSLATGLAAQKTIVSPPYNTTKEGVTSQNYPFGYRSTTPTQRSHKYQQIHDNLSANAIVINSLAFRRDASTYPDYEAYSLDLELALSTAPVASGAMTSTFANNLGPDLATMIAKTKIKWPATVPGFGMPKPFVYQLPFDSGKSFPLAASAPLAWQAIVYDNDLDQVSADYRYFDATYNTSSGTYSYYGQGCMAPGQYQSFYGYFTFTYSTSAPAGHRLYGYAYNGPKLGYLFALLAPKGLQFGMPLGAPCCYLWIDPAAFLVAGPYPLSGSGAGSKTSSDPILVLPNDPAHFGFTVFAQWVAFDAAVTDLWLANGIETQKGQVVTATGVSRLYWRGDVSAPAATGTLSLNYGLVTEFGIQ